MLRNFYKKHKEWFSLFTSAFAGTLLGIGITLALSTYEKYERQETSSLRCLIVALDELDTRLNTMQQIADQMAETDSLFQEVLDYTPDELDEMPQKLIHEFDNELNHFTWRPTFTMAENMLLGNMEILDTFQDLSTIKDLNILYEIVKYTEKSQADAQSSIEKMLRNYCKREDYHNEEIDHAFIKKFFQDHEVYDILHKYHDTTQIAPTLIETGKQLKTLFQQKLEIDSTDIALIRNTHLENVSTQKSYTN